MNNKEESVDVVIYGSRVSVLTDEPEQIRKFAELINTQLNELTNKYQGIKPNLILILQCLKMQEKNSQLEKDLDDLIRERESLDSKLKGVLFSID